MEIRVIGRAALAGVVAGLLGFVFAWLWAEPVIGAAIDYEGSRDEIIEKLNAAAGIVEEAHEHEYFSREFQSTIGIATGSVLFAVSMALLVAVAYLLLRRRSAVRPQPLVWGIAGFGFLAMFMLPFVKYPSNPPSIGHDFTIAQRTQLYLLMVVVSFVLLGAAVWLARRLRARLGLGRAALVSTIAFLGVFGAVLAVLPSLGDLALNVASSNELGFARAATETPAPIVNTLGTTVEVDGMTYAPGQIVFPGFDADLLWQFRWFSILNQMLVWSVLALVLGTLLERLSPTTTPPAAAAREPAGVA